MEIERVKVDVQCPCCGFCKVLKVSATQKGMFCPGCNLSLFMRWATGTKGEVDEHGLYFLAYEPFQADRKVKEVNAVFGL